MAMMMQEGIQPGQTQPILSGMQQQQQQSIPMPSIEDPDRGPDRGPARPQQTARSMEEYDYGIIPVIISFIIALAFFPIALCVCLQIVQEYERAVIFRLGKILSGGAKGPGIIVVWPCIDEYKKVDLRTKAINVPPQTILTKDSVSVMVDAVVYYRVADAVLAVAVVEDADQSTSLLAQTALRDALGVRSLAEILSGRDDIVSRIQRELDEATDPWGIKVERVEVKDVRLPPQLQRAMAAEAEAAREARAKVIIAEGEKNAARALAQASQVIGDSEISLQLRYLQTMNQVAGEKNSTILFPLPMDIMPPNMDKKKA